MATPKLGNPNQPGDTIRVVGRCKACKTGIAHTGAVSYRPTKTNPNGARYYGDVECAGNGTDYAAHVTCECGARVRLELVYRKHGGSHSAPCNATCTDAKGASCDCSCQGLNHGSGNKAVRS